MRFLRVIYSDPTVGDMTERYTYSYDAWGRSLTVVLRTDYVGNLIYDRTSLKKVLFDGGYVEVSGNTRNYRFFVKDHLGNNRLVTDASGTILQTNHYDPYGESLPDGAAVDSGNPYKYSGKEFDDKAMAYDFGARHYTSSIPRWTTMDPMAEKYYSISPYAYCAGNPVNLVDPQGKEGVKYTDENGNKIIESNVVVLLEQEIQITDDMSERERTRAQRKNNRIRRRNETIMNDVNTTLTSVFGKQENSRGETVTFVFNIIGVQVKAPAACNLKEARVLAEAYGIPAETPNRIDGAFGSGIALAAVVSQAGLSSSTRRGEAIGNLLITLNYAKQDHGKLSSALGHEMGHTLKLTHPLGGASSGLMCYPPEGLLPEEVDTIWGNAYNKL